MKLEFRLVRDRAVLPQSRNNGRGADSRWSGGGTADRIRKTRVPTHSDFGLYYFGQITSSP